MVEMKEEQLRLMEERLCISPRKLATWAGKDSCCIFRVPTKLRKINMCSYEPQVVSIGPYHGGHSSLTMFEEHKWLYLRSTLDRTKMKVQDLMKVIYPLESKARDCYSEKVQMNSEEFMEMMLLDGCFILELFRRVDEIFPSEENDPIFIIPWVLSSLAVDFLKLENQIPYCILLALFKSLPAQAGETNLPRLALEFFYRVSGIPKNADDEKEPRRMVNSRSDHEHLLDLVRATYTEEFSIEIPRRTCSNGKKLLGRLLGIYRDPFEDDEFKPISVISTMSKLKNSGIKAKKVDANENFLAVTFDEGVLYMSTITFSSSMGSFLHNCIAYEQCYGRTNLQFTTYALLLDYLVDTTQDVEAFCEEKIFENLPGSDEELLRLINRLGKEITWKVGCSYLYDDFVKIERYYNNPWLRH